MTIEDDVRLLLGENRRALARLRAIHTLALQLRAQLHSPPALLDDLIRLTREDEG